MRDSANWSSSPKAFPCTRRCACALVPRRPAPVWSAPPRPVSFRQDFQPGPVGVVSRSGTLSYEVSGGLSAAGIGQSTVVGLGADPVVGTDITDLLQSFDDDPQTSVVVLIGEVGGSQEERAAHFVREHMQTPVVAYIAGRCAVPGVAMGHAGALVREGSGTVDDKIAALEAAGIRVAATPAGVVELVKEHELAVAV